MPEKDYDFNIENKPVVNFLVSMAMEYINKCPGLGREFSLDSFRAGLFSHAANITNHLYEFSFKSPEDQIMVINIFAQVLWGLYIYRLDLPNWQSTRQRMQKDISKSLIDMIEKINNKRLRYSKLKEIKNAVKNHDVMCIIDLVEARISKQDVEYMKKIFEILKFLNKKIPYVLIQYDAVYIYVSSIGAVVFYSLINKLKLSEPAQASGKEKAEKNASSEDPFYCFIRQGVGTNTLIDAIPKKTEIIEYDAITKKSIIRKNDFIVEYDGFPDNVKKGLSAKTFRLFEALVYRFTQDGARDPLITMPIDEYMEMCGLSSRDATIRHIDEALDSLTRIKQTWKESRKKALSEYDDIYIFGGRKGRRNGKIYFRLSEEFFKYLSKQPVMRYPMALFRINHKENPHSYFLGRKLTLHKRVNWKNNKSDGDTLSVKTLMQSMPYLPSYEDVRVTRGQFKQLITRPFLRDLDALVDTYRILSNYSIIPRYGYDIEITNDLTYDELQMCNIKAEWNDYPSLGDIAGE